MPFSRIRCFHHVLQLSGALSAKWSLSTNLMKFHQVCHFCQIRRFAIFVNVLGPTSHVISIHSYNFVNKLGRNFVRFATFAEFTGYFCGCFGTLPANWFLLPPLNLSEGLLTIGQIPFIERISTDWQIRQITVITCYHMLLHEFLDTSQHIWVCLNLLSTVQ